LLGVTAWIAHDAILEILYPEYGGVNVAYLYAFSSLNAVVDCICFCLFYFRREDILHDVNISHASDTARLAEDQERGKGSPPPPNLNMMSALSHVSSDTLRTTSVFIAAIVATSTNIHVSLCDAWAAIIVTFTIVCGALPLASKIYDHAKSHRFITG
jgi:Co/Zn/Cd efflux system component